MNENEASFQRLGELVLEEILVRAGIEQPRALGEEELSVTLDFRVWSDEQSNSVLVEGSHYDGAPYQLRLEIGG